MKTMITKTVTAVAAIAALGFTVPAQAEAFNCAKANANVSWYEGKAKTTFGLYYSCKASEWITHANCGKIHEKAEYYNKKAHEWERKWMEECAD